MKSYLMMVGLVLMSFALGMMAGDMLAPECDCLNGGVCSCSDCRCEFER